MKRLIVILLLLHCMVMYSQKSIGWSPFAQQGGIYYSSGHVTTMGYGFGMGVLADCNYNIVAQTDFNVYWLNGNTYKNSVSLGYKKPGIWSPAVFCNVSMLWGSRSEILLDDGSRPAPVVWTLGLKLAPLRFENEKGFITALEYSIGFGQYHGICSELVLFGIGIKL